MCLLETHNFNAYGPTNDQTGLLLLWLAIWGGRCLLSRDLWLWRCCSAKINWQRTIFRQYKQKIKNEKHESLWTQGIVAVGLAAKRRRRSWSGCAGLAIVELRRRKNLFNNKKIRCCYYAHWSLVEMGRFLVSVCLNTACLLVEIIHGIMGYWQPGKEGDNIPRGSNSIQFWQWK